MEMRQSDKPAVAIMNCGIYGTRRKPVRKFKVSDVRPYAIRALVAQYPDLIFIGLFAHDYPERYFQFEGRAGEVEVREYPLPPDEDEWEPPDYL